MLYDVVVVAVIAVSVAAVSWASVKIYHCKPLKNDSVLFLEERPKKK